MSECALIRNFEVEVGWGESHDIEGERNLMLGIDFMGVEGWGIGFDGEEWGCGCIMGVGGERWEMGGGINVVGRRLEVYIFVLFHI